MLSLKVSRLGILQGEISGFKEISGYKKYRQTMSLLVYQEWVKLRYF